MNGCEQLKGLFLVIAHLFRLSVYGHPAPCAMSKIRNPKHEMPHKFERQKLP